MPRGNPDLAIAMGLRIAKRRKELGLTQEKAADKAGIAYQQYNKAEKGRTCLSSDTLQRISVALDISADYLLSGNVREHKYADTIALLDRMSNRQCRIAVKILQDLLEFSQENDI